MTDQTIAHIDGVTGGRRHFRYFDYVMACFVAILLLSNLIGAAKLSTVAGYTFGAGILFMLAESLVALHVDQHERSRVMAIQRTLVMLVSAPFGWISGWLSDMNRTWPFLLTSALLVIGIVAAARFWVTTHAPTDDESRSR